jgi:hypothetical protein
MNLSLSEIAKQLGGEVSGGSALCPGPGHSVADRSLSVMLSSTAPDGFVVKTFTADDINLCRDHVRVRLGLAPFQPKDKQQKTRQFDFRDPATGEARYAKIRHDNADGTKKIYFKPTKRGGSPALLYGGERLAKTVPDAPIWIVEGENKVDRLVELGAVAVSQDAGAKSRWLADHAKPLRGRRIILWPDSDQAGEGYIYNAAAIIRDDDRNADIRVVRPFPAAATGEKGKDVCDWLGDAAALLALADGAERYAPTADNVESPKTKFRLEPFGEIRFDASEQWLIKGILPREGAAALYGKFGSFKSFAAGDIALHVATGTAWAGRRVTKEPVVYVAAEGAQGFRKRLEGFRLAHPNTPSDAPFFLISDAPNLGAEHGDAAALCASIEGYGVSPGLIVIDTLSATLASADENGAGMVQFVTNANALARRFHCLVLVVHHVGHGDAERMRGHSSFAGAADAIILCERPGDELATTLTLQKAKDEASNIRLTAHLSRIVIGHDQDGDEISTLTIETVEDIEPGVKASREQKPPASARLLMEVVAQAVDEAGETFRPWSDGPPVRGVDDDQVRRRLYERIAEQAGPDDDATKLGERQRRAFNRSIEVALKSKLLAAVNRDGTRFVWQPDGAGQTGTPLKGVVPVRPVYLASSSLSG